MSMPQPAQHLRVTGPVATVLPWMIAGSVVTSGVCWLLVGRLYPDVGDATTFLVADLAALVVLALWVRPVATAGHVDLTGLIGISYLLLVSLGFTVVAWEIGQGVHFSLGYCALAAVGSVLFAVRPWHFLAGLTATLTPPVVFVCAHDAIDPIGRTVALLFAAVTAVVCTALYVVLRHANSRADAAAQAIQHQATHDGLTGIANRSHWLLEADQRLVAADRRGLPVTLLVIDVDAFKTLNDTWGHEAGDRVLVTLAEALRHAAGPNGLPGRMGGDEFLVLLPGAGDDAARSVADRARQRFDDAMAGRPASTFSVGQTEHDPGETLATLIARADRRMYQDKRRGRASANVVPLFGLEDAPENESLDLDRRSSR